MFSIIFLLLFLFGKFSLHFFSSIPSVRLFYFLSSTFSFLFMNYDSFLFTSFSSLSSILKVICEYGNRLFYILYWFTLLSLHSFYFLRCLISHCSCHYFFFMCVIFSPHISSTNWGITFFLSVAVSFHRFLFCAVFLPCIFHLSLLPHPSSPPSVLSSSSAVPELPQDPRMLNCSHIFPSNPPFFPSCHSLLSVNINLVAERPPSIVPQDQPQ